MTIEQSNGVMWFRCEKCGKKLIQRLPNGLWRFVFGKKKTDAGILSSRVPVMMEVHGSIRMKCLSGSCDHINILNYFPNPIEAEQSADTVCVVES